MRILPFLDPIPTSKFPERATPAFRAKCVTEGLLVKVKGGFKLTEKARGLLQQDFFFACRPKKRESISDARIVEEWIYNEGVLVKAAPEEKTEYRRSWR